MSVHPDSKLDKETHIYVIKSGDASTPDQIFNITMMMSDITTGINSYYILQVIFSHLYSL